VVFPLSEQTTAGEVISGNVAQMVSVTGQKSGTK
jgi:hypothetical protein